METAERNKERVTGIKLQCVCVFCVDSNNGTYDPQESPYYEAFLCIAQGHKGGERETHYDKLGHGEGVS